MRGRAAGSRGWNSPARTWAAVIVVNGADRAAVGPRQNVGWAMSTWWCESSVTVMSSSAAPAARISAAVRCMSACAPATGSAGAIGAPVSGSTGR